MKTAMQEFYDEVVPLLLADDIRPLYWNFRKLYNKAMIKEKEQIRDAYNEGHTDAMEDKPGMTSGTIYYNETYKIETNEKETNP